MSEIEVRLDQAIEELKESIEYLLNSLVTGISDKKDTTDKLIEKKKQLILLEEIKG